jgi:hypothetical protein
MVNWLGLLAGYRLPAGKHTRILTHFQTKVKKKTSKKHKHFLDHEDHELKSHRERRDRGGRREKFIQTPVAATIFATAVNMFFELSPRTRSPATTSR